MALITSSKIKDTYLRKWREWIPAIFQYGKGLKNKPIQNLLLSVTTELGMYEIFDFKTFLITANSFSNACVSLY